MDTTNITSRYCRACEAGDGIITVPHTCGFNTAPVVGPEQPTCRRCGEPAKGYATIGDERFCHGDEFGEATCYMRESWDRAGVTEGVSFDKTTNPCVCRIIQQGCQATEHDYDPIPEDSALIAEAALARADERARIERIIEDTRSMFNEGTPHRDVCDLLLGEIAATRGGDDAPVDDQRQRELLALGRYTHALSLIAAPMRPDGTWNRDREACRRVAQEALDG